MATAYSDVPKALAGQLERIARKGKRLVLRHEGREVAALVPLEDLELLRQLEDQLDLEDVRRRRAEAKRKGFIPLEKIKASFGP